MFYYPLHSSLSKWSNLKIYFSVILIISVTLVCLYSFRLPVVSFVMWHLNISLTSDDSAMSTRFNFQPVETLRKKTMETNNETRDSIMSRMKEVALTKGGIDVNKTLKESRRKRNQMIEAAIVDGVKHVRNIPPYPYIMGHNGQSFFDNSSCAPFPTLFDLRFTNTYWQTQIGTNWTFQIFGAYWDDRELNEGGPSIRILGIADRALKDVTAFCQIWFEFESTPKIFTEVILDLNCKPSILENNFKMTFAEMADYDLAWKFGIPGHRKYNGAIPYIWNCPVTPVEENDPMPFSVSVVEKICDAATTNVKIHYEKPKKKEKVAVCVRAMNFPDTDVSINLVEWLEIIKLLGAHKVFLYEQNVHPNISKVYEYYTELGFVDVVKVTFPEGLPNEASLTRAYDLRGSVRAWMTEILPLNDCLYRNMYKYDYLAVIDIDEIIVPSQSGSWQELIENLESTYGQPSVTNVTSFAFRNTIFHSEVKLESDSETYFDIPPYLKIIKEVYRSCDTRPQGHGTKCFHNPARVKMLHNHYPFECLQNCHAVEVNASYSDVHHHRSGLLQFKFCENDTFTIDTSLWKWKDEIIQNAVSVLQKLNLVY